MGLLKLGICLVYGCFVCHYLRDTVRIQRDRNISLGWFKPCFVPRKDLGIDAAGVNSSFGSLKGKRNHMNTSTCYIWTEYHEMGVEGIRAVSDYKVYTADAVLDLLRFVAPTMMKSGDAYFSCGIVDNLNDPKYKYYKYWSNLLKIRLTHQQMVEMRTLL